MARSWDRTVRDCTLPTVMEALYANEINCGLQSFWDGGWTVWIGDEMNGHKREETFARDQFDLIPAWLADTAERLYPLLSRVPPEFDEAWAPNQKAPA